MDTKTINPKLTKSLEHDLDIAMEAMLDSKAYDTMDKCLELVKESYVNHAYYKGLLDEYKTLRVKKE